jgi:hypothetical protein
VGLSLGPHTQSKPLINRDEYALYDAAVALQKRKKTFKKSSKWQLFNTGIDTKIILYIFRKDTITVQYTRAATCRKTEKESQLADGRGG